MSRDLMAIELREQVLILTLSRGDVHNALDADTCEQLGRAIDRAEADAAVRAVIVTGAGDKAFSAGFDLQYAERHPEVYRDPLFGSQVVRRPLGTKPLIAAVNGLALGMGFELALACDLVIAARHATFALPEPSVGLTAIGGGVVRLARQIGVKRALGVALTSRRVSAEEAHQLGFVNEVTDEPVVEAALRWAAQIANGAPLATAATLQMAYRGSEIQPLAEALNPNSYPTAMQVLASEDAQEGRRAFLEKRRPSWQGR